MAAGESMRLDRDGGIARLTFTDPARGNPIDGRFCAEMADVAADLATDRAVRCILVAAEGRAFSYGGDIASFVDRKDDLPRLILSWTTTLHSAVARLQRIDAPIVAAVHGMCAGGMAGFVAGCDLVLASEKASFYAAYPGIGFSCDAGSSIMIARRMGPGRARRFFLLDEKLNAAEARDAGLVDELVGGDALAERAEAVAARLAAGPTRAYGEMRRLLLSVTDQPLDTQLEREAQALARCAATADAQEGFAAFLSKRTPEFQGR